MKILIVGNDFPDSAEYNIYEALKGEHQAVIFNPYKAVALAKFMRVNYTLIQQAWFWFLKGVFREPYIFINKSLIEKVRRFKPDLVFVIDMNVIYPETVKRIKSESNAAVIGWFQDHIANFQHGYFLVADYDALFFKDKFIVDLLRKKFDAKNIYYLPQCCNPEVHKIVALTPKEQSYYGCDLTIAGNIYYYRTRVLDQFVDYDFKIWGNKAGWIKSALDVKYMNRYVAGIEKSKAMRASRIVLNNNHYAEISGINKRTFEVAGCGAFQLTDGPGIVDVFRPGEEIVTFDSKKDLKGKVDYYLAHPDERIKIAEKAQKRAHAEHTYAHRWNSIMNILKQQGVQLPK